MSFIFVLIAWLSQEYHYQIFDFCHVPCVQEKYNIPEKKGFFVATSFLDNKFKAYVAPMSKKLPSVSINLKLSTALWLPWNLVTSPARDQRKHIKLQLAARQMYTKHTGTCIWIQHGYNTDLLGKLEQILEISKCIFYVSPPSTAHLRGSKRRKKVYFF